MVRLKPKKKQRHWLSTKSAVISENIHGWILQALNMSNQLPLKWRIGSGYSNTTGNEEWISISTNSLAI